MRYLLLGVVFMFCSCKNSSKPIYPDKSLKEIKIFGDYIPKLKDEKFQKNANDVEVYSDERFEYSGEAICYNKEKNKEAIFNQNLIARLYDRDGKMLAEDVSRVGNGEIIFYLPYLEKNDSIYIIRLEGNKGIIIKRIYASLSLSDLRKISIKENHLEEFPSSVYVFSEESECHIYRQYKWSK